jgi:AcrR family transcriptional regulator
VAENQRWRLLGATADLFYEQGRLGITSKRIAVGAGVSASTFYRYFDDVADCLRACFEVAADSLLRALRDRRRDAPDGHRGGRSGAEALVAFTESEPQLASLLGAELVAAQKTIAPRRQRLIAQLGALLEGKGEAAAGAGGEHLAVAALALCCRRRNGDAPVPPDLATQLAALLEPAGLN